MTLGTFFIRTVIIHEMPRSSKASPSSPTLSEAPSVLDDRNRNHFRERIARTLTEAAFQIEYDPSSDSPVPALIIDYFSKLGDEATFVDISKQMALHLHSLHTGATSPGLLAVIEAVEGSGTGGGRKLVLLKLEKESGVEVTPTQTPDGRATFSVQVLETTLNEKTRVFKAAMFDASLAFADIRGKASDNQRSAQFGEEISSYFMSFLGCRHRQDPARATAEFVDRVQQFVNTVVTADNRAALQTAMLAELASEDRFIDPVQFADRYLPSDMRDDFLQPFVAPDGSSAPIEKDDSLIDEALAKVVYLFENGLVLTGPAAAIQDDVSEEGQDTWTIRSRRTTVTAKAPFRRAKP